uniref:DRBM domain-containing protein n=1 Tax=Schistocephalus solidus TaxID=70667 RepID=A0A0V0JBM0_SCHSO
MEEKATAKRRKTNDDQRKLPAANEVSRKQADAHILSFLKTVISEAQTRNLKKKSTNAPSKRIVEKRDACTQTEEPPDNLPLEAPLSPTSLLSRYAPASSDNPPSNLDPSALGIFSGPTNTDLRYFTTAYARSNSSNVPSDVNSAPESRLTSSTVKQLVNKWMLQYEEWFYNHFGVDVRTAVGDNARLPTPFSDEPIPKDAFNDDVGFRSAVPIAIYAPPSEQMSIAPSSVSATTFATATTLPSQTVPIQTVDTSVGCQTYQISRAPVVYPQSLFFPAVVSQPTALTVPFSNPYLTLHAQSNALATSAAGGLSLAALAAQPVNPLFTYLNTGTITVPTIANLLSSVTTGCVSQSPLSQSLIAPSVINPNVLATLNAMQPSSARVSFPTMSSLFTGIFPNMCTQPTTTVANAAITSDPLAELDFSTMLTTALYCPESEISGLGTSSVVTQYGVYAVLRSPETASEELKAAANRSDNDDDARKKMESKLPVHMAPPEFHSNPNNWMPPPPPTVLLLQKQALICALQIHIRDKMREIESRKACAKRPIDIDYITALESTVEKSVKVKVAYVHNRINCLPEDALTPFLCGLKNAELDATDATPIETNVVQSVNEVAESTSTDNSSDDVPITAVCEEKSRNMYICDLLIGDVFICQALAGHKHQSKACAARKAMTILSEPSFLVGGIRRWNLADYLILCLSPKADLVPRLSPFLYDPLSLIPKDRVISEGDPMETFKIINPKPVDDLWLYTALPISVDWKSTLSAEQILAQSAEFSQMTVDFEVEFDSVVGNFVCYGLVDGHCCSNATAVNVVIARANAAHRLLEYLQKTQPVVGLLLPPPEPDDEPLVSQEDLMHPLWGLTEATIVDSLMWGKEERQFALPIEHLEAHCEVPPLPNSSTTDGTEDTEFGGCFPSQEVLEHYIQAYAASAVVTPLRISNNALPRALWPLARKAAHAWGLLTRIEFELPDNLETAFLLVCKRAPLPRLKRTLYERTELGVFYLLDRGHLGEEAMRRLLEAEIIEEMVVTPVEESGHQTGSVEGVDSVEDPTCHVSEQSLPDDDLSRMARRFHETSQLVSFSVKQEPDCCASEQSPAIEDCVLVRAELNQPSNAIEILDDLPRQLIPGIDF